MNKLLSLQYGRAIAALAVVFYHFSGYHQANQEFEPFRGFFKFGHLGVDFFFVLSGFVIMMAHKKDLGQSSRIVSFGLKRFFRIFPTYWFHLSFIILIRISAGILFHQDSFYRDFDFSFMLDNFLLLPTGKYLIGPAWSLSYELFFYLLFSLGLIFPRKIFFVLLFLYCGLSAANISMGFSFAPHYVVEFFMGVLGFVIFDRYFLTKGQSLGLFCTCLFVLALEWLLSWLTNYNIIDSKNPWFLGLPMMGLILGMCSYERKAELPRIKFLEILGEASFVLYISHMIFQTMAHQVYIRLNMTPTLVIFAYFGLLAFCIVYSIVYYKYLEKPMQSKFREFINSLEGWKLGLISKDAKE
jgi:exopolysaccharide production protein ExoZ